MPDQPALRSTLSAFRGYRGFGSTRDLADLRFRFETVSSRGAYPNSPDDVPYDDAGCLKASAGFTTDCIRLVLE